jgi:hypothetical protein
MRINIDRIGSISVMPNLHHTFSNDFLDYVADLLEARLVGPTSEIVVKLLAGLVKTLEVGSKPVPVQGRPAASQSASVLPAAPIAPIM